MPSKATVQYLRALWRYSGLTQAAVAKDIGLSTTWIGNVIHGHKDSRPARIQVAASIIKLHREQNAKFNAVLTGERVEEDEDAEGLEVVDV